MELLKLSGFITEDCHARNITTDCDDPKIQNHRDDNNTILASSETFYIFGASKSS